MTVLGSRIALFMSSMLCLALSAALVIGASGFYNSMNGEATRGIVVLDYTSSIKGLSFTPLSMRALSRAKRDDLLKKLIVQYVVKRYTLTGGAADARNQFGTGALNDMSGIALRFSSLAPGQIDYGQPFASLQSEAAERNRILSEGMTRTVEIVREPYLYKDNMWIVEVEFIYRAPGVWRIEEANRETFEIQLVLEPISYLRPPMAALELKTASVIFGWYIKSTNRVRK